MRDADDCVQFSFTIIETYGTCRRLTMIFRALVQTVYEEN